MEKLRRIDIEHRVLKTSALISQVYNESVLEKVEELKKIRRVVKNFEAKTVGYTESRARGMITIFNNFGTSPQTLIKTTRFESKLTGLVFRLQETITVPGAVKQGDKLIPGSIKTEVVADEIGEKYNIVSDDFVIAA